MKKSITLFSFLFLTIGLFGQSDSKSLKYSEGDELFKVVEQMPRFPGCENIHGDRNEKKKCGEEKMLQYIYANLEYPQSARDQKVEGRAILQFVVQKDGTLTSINVVRDPGAGTGTAAQNVMKKMNSDSIIWTPGMQRGKPVNVLYTLPILFRLENQNTTTKQAEFVFPPPPPPPSDDEIFRVVEQMPRFPGCQELKSNSQELKKCADKLLYEYIDRITIYPKEAIDANVEGRAIAQFVINKRGELEDIRIVRDPGYGCGEAAITALTKMQEKITWIAGKQRGRPVSVLYTLPIRFLLNPNADESDKPQKSPVITPNTEVKN